MTEEKKGEIGEILQYIAEELDIPESMYEDAVDHYNAVGDYLDHNESSLHPHNPQIYPQGSFALGTVVKPLGRDEYDIDLVCLLNIAQCDTEPSELKNMVGDRLKESETYKEMLIEKNRCWRLNYTGKFHMDILPAIPDPDPSLSGNAISVPDKELSDWSPSNPKDYAKWFKDKMLFQYRAERKALAERMKLDVESVPDHEVKTTLQISVQIIKRHRDIYFQNNSNDKPASIIITTLAANAYNNEKTLYDALANITTNMEDYIEERNGVYWVENPTNPKENFADKWQENSKKEDRFFSWIEKLKQDFKDILVQEGIPEFANVMNPMFGLKIVKKCFDRYGEKMKTKREDSKLKVASTGLLGNTGTSVKPHNFYGE